MILSVNDKNAMLQGLADKLNVGSDTALKIYVEDMVIVNFTMPNPINLSIVGGVLTFNLPERVLATESGVPTIARMVNSAGSDITFNIGTEVVLDKEGIYAGGYVSLTRLTIAI